MMMMINVLFINLLKMMTIMMSSHLVKHAVPDGAPLTEHVVLVLVGTVRVHWGHA